MRKHSKESSADDICTPTRSLNTRCLWSDAELQHEPCCVPATTVHIAQYPFRTHTLVSAHSAPKLAFKMVQGGTHSKSICCGLMILRKYVVRKGTFPRDVGPLLATLLEVGSIASASPCSCACQQGFTTCVRAACAHSLLYQ